MRKKMKINICRVAFLSVSILYESLTLLGQSSSYDGNVQPILPLFPAFGNNVAFGWQTLNTTGTGPGNTATGNFSHLLHTTGEFNTSAGMRSLYSNTSGNQNTALGFEAMFNNTSAFSMAPGTNNVAIGHKSLYGNLIGVENTADGAGSLGVNQIGNFNTATGYYALAGNSPNPGAGGHGNTATGAHALAINTFGTENTAEGKNAMRYINGGNSNTAFGLQALGHVTGSSSGGNRNTALGVFALLENTGSSNTGIGLGAMQNGSSNGSNNNCAFGVNALKNNNTGFDNVAVGYHSLFDNLSGYENVAVGTGALFYNENASSIVENFNTAVGGFALFENKGSQYDVGIGYFAGGLVNLTSTSPRDLTFVGAYADVTTPLTNCGAIGYLARVDSSNKIRVGNTNVTYVESPINVTPSDGRFKYHINEEVIGRKFINELRPVVYNLETEKLAEHLLKNVADSVRRKMPVEDYSKSKAIRHSGFIAQEVEQAALKTNYNFSGVEIAQSEQACYGLAYEQFVIPLVKAVQEQQAIITEQQSTLNVLEKRIIEQQQIVDRNYSGPADHQNLWYSDDSKEIDNIVIVDEATNDEYVVKTKTSSNGKNAKLLFHNLSGKQILLIENNQSMDSFTIAKNKLPNGIYIVSLTIDDKTVSSRNLIVHK